MNKYRNLGSAIKSTSQQKSSESRCNQQLYQLLENTKIKVVSSHHAKEAPFANSMRISCQAPTLPEIGKK
jgi:hypothetical protein